MKKILFLLLVTISSYGQTLQNPTFGNTTTNTLKIKTPATVTSVNYLSTIEADGSVAKILPVNLGFALDSDVVHKAGIETKTGGLTINGTSAPISLVGNSVNNIGVSASSDNGLPLSVSTTTGAKLASFILNGAEKSSIKSSGGYVVNGVTSTNALLAGGGNLANPVSGTGTNGNISKWSGTGTQNNSSITEGASLISTTKSLDISGSVDVLTLRKPSSNMPGILMIGATSNTIFEGGEDLAIYTNSVQRLKISKAGVYNFPGLAGTGTRTVVADASGNLSATSTPPDPRPYKVYTALISQTGTSAPTAVILENTLGGTVVFGYSGVGIYTATLSGAFVNNKTSGLTGNNLTTTQLRCSAYRIDNNTCQINSTTYLGVSTDGALNGTLLEIRVYN